MTANQSDSWTGSGLVGRFLVFLVLSLGLFASTGALYADLCNCAHYDPVIFDCYPGSSGCYCWCDNGIPCYC
jgi:hypothetical protein